MIGRFKDLWGDYVEPIYRRPERLQFAALCYRGEGEDLRVLLITSRDTGRWVLPKGWPMRGRDGAGTALREAWEEAGVRKAVADTLPLGDFVYDKGLKGDWCIPVRCIVYSARVTRLEDDFPEMSERRRVWVTPAEAASMVNEPGLQGLLRQFASRNCRIPVTKR
ncbi:NUDIX hydrolase [Sagittula sp. S175]|uniref:NUDIX hydrolase n=1 Tax=Sagittula sp. S175 TaxID=3415129 RepID=UPI003C7E177B